MPVVRESNKSFVQIHAGLRRTVIHTEALMTVINEFTDGPWDKPEPMHSHPHEQTGYLAEGEVIFYCEGEEDQRLVKGDMFCAAPNVRHTIKCLTPVVRIVDSFTPIRQEFLPAEEK